MKKVNSRHLQKLNKNVSELSEMKKLRHKHFRKKDRNYLFENINSFDKKIERILKADLKIIKNNANKLQNSKDEIKKVSQIVDGLIVKVNQKLRTLKHQEKLVEEYRLELSKRKNLLENKLRGVNKALNEKSKRITLIRNLKKKV